MNVWGGPHHAVRRLELAGERGRAALSLTLPAPLEEPLVNSLVSTARFMALQASMELQGRSFGGNWLA